VHQTCLLAKKNTPKNTAKGQNRFAHSNHKNEPYLFQNLKTEPKPHNNALTPPEKLNGEKDRKN
jgi:hypothetical protein